MINKKNIIAIIPARGGSIGIPKKNLVKLADKPLISHTIEHAKSSKYIDRIIVSTDNKEIAEVSEKEGAEVIIRPKELSGGVVPTLPVLKHVIEKIEKEFEFDIIILLQPTSPLRKVESIDLAIEKLDKKDCDSVISVCELEHNPVTIVEVKEESLSMKFPEFKDLRRQGTSLCRINGAIYAVKKDVVKNSEGYFIGNDVCALKMDKRESIDIDDKDDLIVAEAYLKND